MDFSQKRVIIADVDETICETCQLIAPEMTTQIASLIRKGFTFAFISGTPQKYLEEMISSRLKERHYLLSNTGTVCTEMRPEAVEKYRYVLTDEERKEVIKALEQLTAAYNLRSLTTKEDQIQDRETQVVLSAIGRHAPLELKKSWDPDARKRKEMITFLKTLLDEKKYEITYGGTTSIDITRKGFDKAWGITKFAQHYNIPLASILFIGDRTEPGGNDYPATKVVDFITVKNPQETQVKLRELELQSYQENRPWGNFEQFTANEKTTVKIITILPGQRLSLQSHQQREEWWIALDDGVIVEVTGEKRTLAAGEKKFVHRGAKHRLSAADKKVRVLEIAFGKFDESDITRYEDDFGRG